MSVVDEARDSVFHAPFVELPAAIPAAERERLAAAGREAILGGVVAGYRELLRFMWEEYLPGARTTIAASELPDGRAYYEHLVRHFTTLDLTPQQVHERGLKEVARIRAEMQALIARVEFDGDFAAFLEFLRSDPRFDAACERSPRAGSRRTRSSSRPD